MNEQIFDTRHWKELGVSEKIKLSLASFLIISSVILGFLSFIWLLEVPGSVIATSGLFGSEALAILGISSYFSNEMTKFNTNVKEKLERLDRREHEKYEEKEKCLDT